MSSTKKPIIGISGNIIIDKDGMIPGYRRAYVNEDYILSVVSNGGVPVILPIVNDEVLVRQMLEGVDALILSGGHDVSPFNYGEEPKPKLGPTYPKRDEFDMKLLKVARELNLPVLGICRGHQIMNVYHGGSLHQDMTYIGGEVLRHEQPGDTKLVTHTADLKEGTLIHKIFGENTIKVNSFHHQSINKVAPGFVAGALAKDGVVESIEDPSYRFMLGVQFHPEMLHQSEEKMNKVFQALIEEAKK